MKKISRLQVTAWVLSLLPAAMTAAFYSRLPAEIPMQWDLAGHMNYETRWHLWIVAGMAPLFAAGIIGAAGSFIPNEIAKFVLVLAPMAAATIISTVLSWRWYRAEQR